MNTLKRIMIGHLFAGLLLVLWTETLTGGDHWPRFRGPGGRGVAEDHPGLPAEWGTQDNVVWSAEISGWGWSSPVVWGNRVFVTTVVAEQQGREPERGLYLGEGVRDPAAGLHRWIVQCLDLRSGKELWRHVAYEGEPQVPRHPKSTYAAETPVTDGKHLYVLFGDLGLYCYNLEGELRWQKPITPRRTFMDYGAAASPVAFNGRVYVVYDNLEDSWVACFDGETGETVWSVPRDEQRSWATPLIWENDARVELVVPGLRRNRSYSLDGELLWEFDGRMSSLVIPSPLAAHGMVYLASGYIGDSHRPTFAVRPGASGELAVDGDFAASPFIEWYQAKASPYNTSQIVVGEYLYTLYDRGFLTCHNALTGEEVFGKRRFPGRASFTTSPWSYNGLLFCLSEEGETYVLEAGAEFRILHRNSLDELCLACPAIVGDRLLVRTASRLYCLSTGTSN